ncbi:MAG: LarC family nickel insertion protein [bacterium]
MNITYLDLFHGVSGEMLLGALVDLGISIADLRQPLEAFPIRGLDLQAHAVRRAGIAATCVSLAVEDSAYTLDQSRKTVADAGIPDSVQERINRVFEHFAEAESAVYGAKISEIQFTGRSIAEIAAVLVGFNLLGIERVSVSEIRVGAGGGQDENDRSPTPDPVVSRLLIGFRVSAGPVKTSLVTPVGAALVRTLADKSESMPSMVLTGIGVGAGPLEIEGHPHILRIFTGRTTFGTCDEVMMIESQIDDMSPEVYGVLLEDAFRAGALDVMLTPVYMKKNRPGTLVTVLTPVGREDDLIQLLLRESTTLGVRLQRVERRVLQRESVTVQTQWGAVHGKVVWGPGVSRRFKPEYEECLRIHREMGVPFIEIADAAQEAFKESDTGSEE